MRRFVPFSIEFSNGWALEVATIETNKPWTGSLLLIERNGDLWSFDFLWLRALMLRWRRCGL